MGPVFRNRVPHPRFEFAFFLPPGCWVRLWRSDSPLSARNASDRTSECSDGCSSAEASPPAAEPVERFNNCFGLDRATEPEIPRRMRVDTIPPPLPGRNCGRLGPRVALEYSLHPWLHTAAPSGAETPTNERALQIASSKCAREGYQITTRDHATRTRSVGAGRRWRFGFVCD